MSTVSEVMVAIADQLSDELGDVVPGIQIEPKIVRSPTPPCIDVYPADPFLERSSFGPVQATARFVVRARVTTVDQQDGQELLLQLLDPTAPASIWKALEVDTSFGAVVDDSTVEFVTGFLPYEVGAAGAIGGYTGSLLGAEWRLRVELPAVPA